MTENDEEEEFEGGLALNILCGACAGIVLFLMMLRDVAVTIVVRVITGFIIVLIVASLLSIALLPIAFILKCTGVI